MYACVDLGSNSFHLLIAQWQDGRVRVLERFSEKVQLGEGLPGGAGNLHPRAVERGLVCLGRFRDAIRHYPVERCWTVGTNALRVAGNASEFLTEAAGLGFDIDVVSGKQEAALVHAGVVTALPDGDEARLVIDIGGGSTELIAGRGRNRDWLCSLPVGCVSWRDRHFADIATVDEGELTRRIDAAVADADGIFARILPELRACDWSRVYASSGTARMLASVCGSNGHGDTAEVSLAALHSLQPLIVRAARDPGFELAGLKENRRQLALPGWTVLTGLMQCCAIEQLTFSASALREGMLYFLAHPDSAAGEGFNPVETPNALKAG